MKKILAVLCIVGIGSVASAGIITPVDASMTSEWQSPDLAIDGSGLDGIGPIENQTHSTAWTAVSMSHPDPTPEWFFDLGYLCELDGAYIWNGNMDWGGVLVDRSIKDFDILVSSDSDPLTATWTMVGSFTINQANSGPESAQFISFSASDVRLVQLDVQSNYGDPLHTTLSEIRFSGTIPEPATMLLMGLGGLFFRRRK